MACLDVVSLPFRAGNLYTSSNGRKQHDGSISAIVVVTSVSAFVTVLISLQAISSSGHVVLDPTLMRVSLTVLVVAGVLSTLLLARKTSRQTLIHIHQNQPTCFRRLKITFLWLFGFGVTLICALDIAVLGACGSDMDKVLHKHEMGVDIVYHTSRILLVITQVCFISGFSSSKLNRSLSTNCSLLFIICANTSVWIYYYFALDTISPEDMLDAYNVTAVNTTNCSYFHNSTIGKISRDVNRVLLPVNTEFSLLTLKLILEMWTYDGTGNGNQTHRNCLMGIESSDDQPHSREQSAANESSDERSSLMDTNWEYRLHNSPDHQYISINKCRPLSLYLGIVCSILLFVPLLVMYIVLESLFPGSSGFYSIIAIYEVTYKVVMLLVVMLSWIYLYKDGKPMEEHQSFNVKDFVLLFSTFGTTIYFMNVLIASVLTTRPIGSTELAAQVISIVCIYLQTTLVLQTRRYAPRFKNIRKCMSFRLLCAVLTVMNFGFWTTDSFLGMKFQAAWTVNAEVYGSVYWAFVMRYFFPLVIFYRLETAFAFLSLYVEFYADAA